VSGLSVGANKLLIMENDIGSFHHIVVIEVFFRFICHSIILQL